MTTEEKTYTTITDPQVKRLYNDYNEIYKERRRELAKKRREENPKPRGRRSPPDNVAATPDPPPPSPLKLPGSGGSPPAPPEVIMTEEEYIQYLKKNRDCAGGDCVSPLSQRRTYTKNIKSWFSYFNTSTVTDTDIGSKQDNKREVGYRDSFKEFYQTTRSELRGLVYCLFISSSLNALVFMVYLLSRLLV